MRLTKRKSLAKAYYSMFTARRKLGPRARSQRGVPHFRNSREEFHRNCDRRAASSHFKWRPMTTATDPLVINILSPRIFCPSLLPSSSCAFSHTSVNESGAEKENRLRRRRSSLRWTGSFQKEKTTYGNHFPGSFPSRGRKRRSF